jgi:hypothetical protein
MQNQFFGHARQQQSPTAGLLGAITQMLQNPQQMQLPQTRGLLPRKDISGNVEGTVPRGLDRWYLNNPQAMRGEFDPNGTIGAGRQARAASTRDFAERDANVQAMTTLAESLAQFDRGRAEFDNNNSGDLASAMLQRMFEQFQQGAAQQGQRPASRYPTLNRVAPTQSGTGKQAYAKLDQLGTNKQTNKSAPQFTMEQRGTSPFVGLLQGPPRSAMMPTPMLPMGPPKTAMMPQTVKPRTGSEMDKLRNTVNGTPVRQQGNAPDFGLFNTLMQGIANSAPQPMQYPASSAQRDPVYAQFLANQMQANSTPQNQLPLNNLMQWFNGEQWDPGVPNMSPDAIRQNNQQLWESMFGRNNQAEIDANNRAFLEYIYRNGNVSR